MAKRRSILDLKHLVPPQPKVARRQLDNGRWQAAIMFPKGVESLIFDRPTERGLENEIIHQCRKMGHQGYDRWDTLQQVWDGEYEFFDPSKWDTLTCQDCGGKGSCPFCSSTGKVYKRKGG